MTRTPFGDVWVSALDPTGRSARSHRIWPLPGPGQFELSFFPLIKRPAFAVFALTGLAVASIRQGGWNLDRGFVHAEPNPVSEVEMRSVLDDGSTVCVLSARERFAVAALHLSDGRTFPSVAERLSAALAARSAPWVVRPVDVDGTQRDVFVLDMHSDALPAGIVRRGLLAVAELDGTRITIICDNPDVCIALTRIGPDDLFATPEHRQKQ